MGGGPQIASAEREPPKPVNPHSGSRPRRKKYPRKGVNPSLRSIWGQKQSKNVEHLNIHLFYTGGIHAGLAPRTAYV